MADPDIVSRSEWLEARKTLLEQEKAFNRQRDALTQARQALPWVQVDKSYQFDTLNKKVSLLDLFDGRSQLIIYHFMFHESWEEGCVSCSFWADNFNGIIEHLNARDVSMAAISQAPIDKIDAYRQRLGWTFNWVSSNNNDFGHDYHVSFTEAERDSGEIFYNYKLQNFPSEEAPGISVFTRDENDQVYHCYSTYSRGLDMLNGAYHYLDIVPKGRDEKRLPWSMGVACSTRCL